MTKKNGTNGKPKRIGRPPEPVPQAFADEVVEWIASGGMLREYCRQPGKPARQTIDLWRDKDPIFAGRVGRARDQGFDVIAEDCLNIADSNGQDTRVTDKGDEVTDGDVIQRSKLRVETRLKLLACWDPRRYGSKVQLGGDGGAPIKIAATGPTVPPTRDLLTGIRRLAGMAEELMPDDEE